MGLAHSVSDETPSPVRVLKKYPNRRLYDTAQSCFIGLEDVKRLVLIGQPFEVQDSKTGDIITRAVLLQIIAEQEVDNSSSLLADAVLRQMIRFYGDSSTGLLRDYLERSIATFMQQQGAFHDQLRSMLGEHRLNMMASVAEQNLAVWKQLTDARGDDRRPDGMPAE